MDQQPDYFSMNKSRTVRNSVSHRAQAPQEEDKVDISELNRRVDVKLRDLLHPP